MKNRSRSPKNFNYEETMTEIEDLIQQIEGGTLPLEMVFEHFATATEKLKACEQFLDRGKARMSLLIETLENAEEIAF